MWLSDFFKQPTVPVLKQVQNQRTTVSGFWRGNVRNQRTTSSGYFQKHERTGRFCRKEPEKNRRLGRQRFLEISKELSPEDLYQNSDQFLIKKKNSLATGKWVRMQCTQVELGICVRTQVVG